APSMELPSFCSHPFWFVLALLLGLLLWATRRRAWDPRGCPTDLSGRTAIVTGANSGEGASAAAGLRGCRGPQVPHCGTGSCGTWRVGPRGAAGRLGGSRGRAVLSCCRLCCGGHAMLCPAVPCHAVPLLNLAAGFQAQQHLISAHLSPSQLQGLHPCGSAPVRAGPFPLPWLGVEPQPHFSGAVPRAPAWHGRGVTANSLNPGVVSTGIMRNFSWVVRGLFFLIRPFIKVSGQGAVSTIYCAVSEEVSGISGKYFGSDCSLTLPSATARDAGLARKLWEESERLTGLSP
uniref:Retinol dehydrogenase 13 n=1 Tax=Pavo cristatus TaxID=9049 RepID=A0A8C9FY41_PAVCR